MNDTRLSTVSEKESRVGVRQSDNVNEDDGLYWNVLGCIKLRGRAHIT